MSFSFSSSAKGQTTQTTPLIEARSEKLREFQIQLLHYFPKSDNKSNHHYQREILEEDRFLDDTAGKLKEALGLVEWCSLSFV